MPGRQNPHPDDFAQRGSFHHSSVEPPPIETGSTQRRNTDTFSGRQRRAGWRSMVIPAGVAGAECSSRLEGGEIWLTGWVGKATAPGWHRAALTGGTVLPWNGPRQQPTHRREKFTCFPLPTSSSCCWPYLWKTAAWYLGSYDEWGAAFFRPEGRGPLQQLIRLRGNGMMRSGLYYNRRTNIADAAVYHSGSIAAEGDWNLLGIR